MARRPGLGALVLVLLAWSATGSAHARNFHAECESALAHGDVTVKTVAAPYLTRHTQSIAELTARNPPPTRTQKTLGLTVARLGTDVEYIQHGLTDPDTREYCMRPTFQVTLAYEPIEVFVGRDIPLDSCGYRHVLRHEERHVAAYRNNLAVASDNVAQAMRAYYRDTIFYGDPERLKNDLADAVNKRWLPFAQRQLAAVDAIQASIDTPQEYRLNQSVCDGQLNAILRASR
jgi:hypothetical protein